jgi:hypothetical protein
VVTVTPLAGAAAVTLNAGQMVEITNEPPASGFQAQAVAQAVQQASMQDTDVPDVAPAIAAQTHLLRNLILGLGVAATGFAVGITQLKTNPAPPPPVVVRCPPNSPKCG